MFALHRAPAPHAKFNSASGNIKWRFGNLGCVLPITREREREGRRKKWKSNVERQKDGEREGMDGNGKNVYQIEKPDKSNWNQPVQFYFPKKKKSMQLKLKFK